LIVAAVLEPDAKITVLLAEDLGRVILTAVRWLGGLTPPYGCERTDPCDDAAEVVRSLPAGVESSDTA
jgi:hypothetical protein